MIRCWCQKDRRFFIDADYAAVIAAMKFKLKDPQKNDKSDKIDIKNATKEVKREYSRNAVLNLRDGRRKIECDEYNPHNIKLVDSTNIIMAGNIDIKIY